jgi:hypothetical protein
MKDIFDPVVGKILTLVTTQLTEISDEALMGRRPKVHFRIYQKYKTDRKDCSRRRSLIKRVPARQNETEI